MKIKLTDESVVVEGKSTQEQKRESAITPSNRKVLFFDEVVVKFDNPHTYHGTQCEAEVLAYLAIEPEDKEYFAPVLDFGEGWLAMERVFFTHPDEVGCEYILNKASKKLRELQEKYGFWDMHEANWGIKIDGSPIIFDYGL